MLNRVPVLLISLYPSFYVVYSRPLAGFQSTPRVVGYGACNAELQHERRHELPRGCVTFAHLCLPPDVLRGAEPGLGVRSHEPNTWKQTIRASGGVETLAALTL